VNGTDIVLQGFGVGTDFLGAFFLVTFFASNRIAAAVIPRACPKDLTRLKDERPEPQITNVRRFSGQARE
jgi:hypothetical protein